MRVIVVAHTITSFVSLHHAGWQHNDNEVLSDADTLGEFAGRLCYQSWDRPNPATATNEGYLKNIIEQEHFSVLEHASVSFYVDGVSRTLSHELVRHRHLSFSQVSQRYVDVDDLHAVQPPAFKGDTYATQTLDGVMRTAKSTAGRLFDALKQTGVTKKQAREAARAVLPNATETKFIVTGNIRAWRDMLKRRLSPYADAEMQVFANRVLAELKVYAPNAMQDFK